MRSFSRSGAEILLGLVRITSNVGLQWLGRGLLAYSWPSAVASECEWMGSVKRQPAGDGVGVLTTWFLQVLSR